MGNAVDGLREKQRAARDLVDIDLPLLLDIVAALQECRMVLEVLKPGIPFTKQFAYAQIFTALDALDNDWSGATGRSNL